MIGSRIGQYRVLALLGEGGMGKVLLVEHAVMGTRHALKMLHDEMSGNDMIVQRFLNEARAAGAIGHRNVVEVSHVDQLEGGGPWYLVMKFLEGQTLAKFLSSRTTLTDQRLIVHVIGEVLNGLQAAHDRRIIHRDLKPDNVFLTAVKGDPYRTVLLDFGVAQLGNDAGLVTKTGAVIGTPQYMAPEQHRGGAIDHRADLWAIGAIVYEMATGRFPYQDDGSERFLSGPEIFHRMMSRPVMDPRRFNPSISEGFSRAILKALAIEPGRRYGSARELAVSLAEATPATRGAPSGIDLLKLHADELLHGVTSPVLRPSAPPAPAMTPTNQVGPQRDPQGATQVLAAASAMSTLGASASQVSPRTSTRRTRYGIAAALGLSAVVVAVVVVAARSPTVATAPGRDPMFGSAAAIAGTTATRDAQELDASEWHAPEVDAAGDVAIQSDAAAPPLFVDARVPADAAASQLASSIPGRLNVVILPWAEVWVDGKPLGQTPVHAKLAAGPHRIRLKNDTKEKTITVTVISAKTTVVDETW